MDSTYAEIGTEVILQKNHKDSYLFGLCGEKALICRTDGSPWCEVSVKRTQEYWWWPIQDMILASDEPLLRK